VLYPEALALTLQQLAHVRGSHGGDARTPRPPEKKAANSARLVAT
jgi:hypothetical protein